MRNALIALGIASLLASPAAAQPAGADPTFTTLFISPSGEPYRGKPDEPYPIVFWFNQTDTNHDGAIDLAEFRADAKGFFEVLDLDHNNLLDGTEVGAYENVIVPDILGRQRVGAVSGRLIFAQFSGAGGVAGPIYMPNAAKRRPVIKLEGAAAYNLLREQEPVANADADLDGRVTLAEFMAATDRRFKRLDTNGDGKLTMAEFPRTDADVQGLGRKKPSLP